MRSMTARSSLRTRRGRGGGRKAGIVRRMHRRGCGANRSGGRNRSNPGCMKRNATRAPSDGMRYSGAHQRPPQARTDTRAANERADLFEDGQSYPAGPSQVPRPSGSWLQRISGGERSTEKQNEARSGTDRRTSRVEPPSKRPSVEATYPDGLTDEALTNAGFATKRVSSAMVDPGAGTTAFGFAQCHPIPECTGRAEAAVALHGAVDARNDSLRRRTRGSAAEKFAAGGSQVGLQAGVQSRTEGGDGCHSAGFHPAGNAGDGGVALVCAQRRFRPA